MIGPKTSRELLVMAVTLLAIFYAGKSIFNSADHQLHLHRQSVALKTGEQQAQQINRELREGLTSYRSSSGIERLARERLNLAGSDEILIRIGR